MGALVRLFKFLRNYRGLVFLSLLFLFVATGMNLVQPKLVEWTVDYGIARNALRSVVLGALGIFGAALLSAGLNFGSGFLLVKAGQGMGYQIRNTLFKKVMSFSFANLDKWRTGELLVRINTDVNTVRMFVRMGLLMIVQSIIMLAGSLIVMYLTNVRLSNIMAIVLPGSLVLFFVSATLIRPLILKMRKRLDAVNNVLQENLAGAKVVRAFARQEYEKQRFDEKNTGLFKLSLKVGYTLSILFPIIFLMGQISVVLITWFGGTAVIENFLNPAEQGLTLGQLLAFNNYALMAFFPIIALGMVLQFLSMASASASRIQELLDEQPSISEKNDALSPAHFRGEVKFDAVSFAYGEGEKALESIDLMIQPGEKVGILGRTGSGKSSLAHLIPRLYEASSGNVSIDGTDVRDLSLQSLRENVSLVLQDTILLSGTIRENMIFANPEVSEGEINRAAEIACVDEIVREKEAGLDEPIGERGVGLSGGQRQRVAIARAVLSKPDILLLDDVTSSLDAYTEKKIVARLYAELKKTTVLIISQKINTIMMSSRIILLDNGRIVDQGSHEDLLESSEMYREIFETQSAEIRA